MATKPIFIPEHGGHDPEEMNDQRAQWAGEAMDNFASATGADHEDVLCDLLCNLMHAAHNRGYDFEAAIFRACFHFEAETSETGK